MTEIKPCPFCGGEASMVIKINYPKGYLPMEYIAYVACDKCGTRGEVVSTHDHIECMLIEKKAIDHWNRRIQ